MQKLSLLILLSLGGFLPLIGQSSLSGTWKGRLTQEEGGLTENYVFRMEIKVEGHQISGRSYIHAEGQPEVHGRMRLSGNLRDSQVFFTESKIEDQEIIDLWQWCQKAAWLDLDTTQQPWTLEGMWRGTPEFKDCSPGMIYLSKMPDAPPSQTKEAQQVLNGREVEDQGKVQVKVKELTLYVWDSDEIDGDVISLNFNGEWILRNQKLGRKKMKLTLEIKSGVENTLVMYAESVGRIPPNTATLAFFDGHRRHKISLASDMSKSGSITFIVDP